VNVGFRLCEGDEQPELLRCLLIRKDYDVLVLAYEHQGCAFGPIPIEQFAECMPCPTVLVGPGRSDELHVNTPAKIWTDILGVNDAPPIATKVPSGL